MLTREDCIYNDELDRYVTDLDIFTGSSSIGIEQPREIQNIVFVTDSYTRVQAKHVRNVLPISTFSGSKKDY